MRLSAILDGRDGVCLEGCEPVAQTAVADPGAALFALFVNFFVTPRNSTAFPWLAQQAELWTKFYFRKIRVWLVPQVGTTTAGVSFAAYSPDPDVGPPSTLQMVQTMAQQQQKQIWNELVFDVDLAQEGDEPYYIDADGTEDRLESQGALFAGTSGAGTDDVSLAPQFQCFIEYVVDLYDRKLTTLTLETRKLHGALQNMKLDEDLRRRAGMAYVEAVLREKKLPARRDKAEEYRSDIVKLLAPPVTGNVTKLPSAAVTAR